MNLMQFIGAAAKYTLVFVIVLFVAALLFARSCCPTPQPEDIEHMRMLKVKFPEYEFSFDCDMYISAKAKTKEVEKKTAQENIKRMYMCFFFDDSWEKRKTWFVYLNYYDSNNVFQYQIHYNKNNKVFDRSLQPHY